MLEVTEREGLADVVSFFSHGRAFAIHKPRRFVQEIMPRFFRQTRLTSFQRQLNLYGKRTRKFDLVQFFLTILTLLSPKLSQDSVASRKDLIMEAIITNYF